MRWCARCSAVRRSRHRVPDGVRVLVRELEAPDRGGLRTDGAGAGGGREVPRASWPTAACASASSAIAARFPTSCARPGSRPNRAPRTTPASRCRSRSTTAAAGTSCRPAAGRSPMVHRCQRCSTRAALDKYMALSYAPDPDLFIRTGGEVRISNFLLWQAAYAELVFSDCLWPEFGDAELDAALAEYARRDRRFGAVPVAGAGASPSASTSTSASASASAISRQA